MTNHIEDQCRAHHIRLTGQRKLIAQAISDAGDHPDVQELHRRVAMQDERISLATVYRTVKRLKNVGIVERHTFRDGPARYERTAKRHHDHLIDMAKGSVIEFQCPKIERLQAAIARHLGYRLVGHRFELYGLRIGSERSKG
jgi:Fur family transcriptional regulator, ferric uptake regulator